MTEALVWFLMTVGVHGQTTIHEIPYAVEWECQEQANLVRQKSWKIADAFCISNSAIDVNAWNWNRAGKWRMTEYE